MTGRLAASYAYCRNLTRQAAGNFGYSFWALPAEQRRGMNVLYAFLRLTDDLGDDPQRELTARRNDLVRWRHDLQSVVSGSLPGHPVWAALAETIRRFDIPVEHLTAVIDGVEMDLTSRTFTTFAELERYCYHVAGAVGLCCIRIWGCRDPAAEPLAIDCGLAFQLTNILRDLGEDAAQQRIYLPGEDLQRFGYSAEDLQRHLVNREFRLLMAFETERARSYYQRAERLMAYLPPPGQRVLRIMREIYGGLLDEMEHREFDVFAQRLRLPTWRKCWITARGLLSRGPA